MPAFEMNSAHARVYSKQRLYIPSIGWRTVGASRHQYEEQ